jgi:RNA polymerase sigma factor (sigma-70 family)
LPFRGLMTFTDTYNKYYPELINYGRQLNLDKQDIEDLVHEAFIRYHKELDKNVRFENPRAWIYKVFYNLVITKKNAKTLHDSKINEMIHAEVIQDIDEERAKEERKTLVFQTLHRLTDKERNLLLLYHHGLKYKEIAEILEMNPDSVGTYLVRTINKLKTLLKSDYHELFR